MPSWRTRQQQRRRSQITRTVIRGVLMLGAMLATILLIARAV